MRVGIVSSADLSDPRDNPATRMDAQYLLFIQRLKQADAVMTDADVQDLESALSNRTAVQAYQSALTEAVTAMETEEVILRALRLANPSDALRLGVSRLAQVIVRQKIDAVRTVRDAADRELRALEQGQAQTGAPRSPGSGTWSGP